MDIYAYDISFRVCLSAVAKKHDGFVFVKLVWEGFVPIMSIFGLGRGENNSTCRLLKTTMKDPGRTDIRC